MKLKQLFEGFDMKSLFPMGTINTFMAAVKGYSYEAFRSDEKFRRFVKREYDKAMDANDVVDKAIEKALNAPSMFTRLSDFTGYDPRDDVHEKINDYIDAVEELAEKIDEFSMKNDFANDTSRLAIDRMATVVSDSLTGVTDAKYAFDNIYLTLVADAQEEMRKRYENAVSYVLEPIEEINDPAMEAVLKELYAMNHDFPKMYSHIQRAIGQIEDVREKQLKYGQQLMDELESGDPDTGKLDRLMQKYEKECETIHDYTEALRIHMKDYLRNNSYVFAREKNAVIATEAIIDTLQGLKFQTLNSFERVRQAYKDAVSLL